MTMGPACTLVLPEESKVMYKKTKYGNYDLRSYIIIIIICKIAEPYYDRKMVHVALSISSIIYVNVSLTLKQSILHREK